MKLSQNAMKKARDTNLKLWVAVQRSCIFVIEVQEEEQRKKQL